MENINIPINAEISELLGKLNIIHQDIDKIGQEAVNAGNTIKRGFSGEGVNKINNELRQTEGLIEDIENEIKKWEIAKRKATSVESIEKYNKKIAEGKKELQEYNTKGLPAIKNVNAEAKKGSSIFAGLGTKIAAAFGTYQIINFAKESYMAYQASQKAEKVLKYALGERSELTQKLIDYAVELQTTTGVSKEDILAQESYLALQGRTEAQIKKTIQAAIDMSKATGDDFNTSLMKLDGTMEGVLGRLTKYDSRLKNISASEMAQGKAIDILAEKFKGVGVESMTATEKMGVSWKELKEAVGERMATAVKGTTSVLGDLADGLRDLIDIPVSDKMQEEKERVNALTGILKDNNKEQKVRKAAYDELLKIAPQVVEGISTENTNIIALNKNLEAYNKQMIVKIILQKQSEKQTEADKEAGEALNKQLETEIDFKTQINELEGKLSYKGKREEFRKYYREYEKGTLTYEQYAQKIIGLALKEKILYKQQIQSSHVLTTVQGKYENLMATLSVLSSRTDKYNKLEDESTKLAKRLAEERDLLIKKFGKEFVDNIENAGDKFSKVTNEMTADEIKAVNEYKKNVLEAKYKLMQQEIDLTDEGTAKLLKIEDLRYLKEKDGLKENTKDKKQLLKLETGALEVHNKNKEDIIEKGRIKEIELQKKYDKQWEEYKKEEQKYPEYLTPLSKETGKTDLERELEADIKAGDLILKEKEDLRDAKIEIAKKTADTIFEIWASSYEKQIDKEEELIDKKYTKDEEALKSLLDTRQITQKEYDRKTKEMEDKRAAEKYQLALKEYKIEQKMAIAKILMQAAIAYAKLKAEAATFKGSVALAALAVVPISQEAILALETAAQIAIVLAAPKPTLRKGGKLDGYSHEQGGTWVNAEKNEWFINKLSSKKYDTVLNNINKDNSFGALKELAKLNGLSMNHTITDELNTKEKAIERQKLFLNEIPEIKEIRDLLKKDKSEIHYGNGYKIEKIGNIERKIYEKWQQ